MYKYYEVLASVNPLSQPNALSYDTLDYGTFKMYVRKLASNQNQEEITPAQLV